MTRAAAPAEVPECPDFLDAEDRAEWFRMAKVLQDMGLLTRADRAALAAYCVVYSRWVTAERQAAVGRSSSRRSELPMNPLPDGRRSGPGDDAEVQVESGWPSSRSRIKVPENSRAGDEFDAFLEAN
jgi:phage terminase small subunit